MLLLLYIYITLMKLKPSAMLSAAIKRQYSSVLTLLRLCLPVFDKICGMAVGFFPALNTERVNSLTLKGLTRWCRMFWQKGEGECGAYGWYVSWARRCFKWCCCYLGPLKYIQLPTLSSTIEHLPIFVYHTNSFSVFINVFKCLVLMPFLHFLSRFDHGRRISVNCGAARHFWKIYVRKNNKMPKFCRIFARKIFFPNFGANASCSLICACGFDKWRLLLHTVFM